MQENLSGAVFHPLDDNLIISHGRGHLSFWHRRKDGFFERTDIIKQPSRTHVTSVQFEPDGDVITADTDGFVTIVISLQLIILLRKYIYFRYNFVTIYSIASMRMVPTSFEWNLRRIARELVVW